MSFYLYFICSIHIHASFIYTYICICMCVHISSLNESNFAATLPLSQFPQQTTSVSCIPSAAIELSPTGNGEGRFSWLVVKLVSILLPSTERLEKSGKSAKQKQARNRNRKRESEQATSELWNSKSCCAKCASYHYHLQLADNKWTLISFGYIHSVSRSAGTQGKMLWEIQDIRLFQGPHWAPMWICLMYKT